MAPKGESLKSGSALPGYSQSLDPLQPGSINRIEAIRAYSNGDFYVFFEKPMLGAFLRSIVEESSSKLHFEHHRTGNLLGYATDTQVKEVSVVPAKMFTRDPNKPKGVLMSMMSDTNLSSVSKFIRKPELFQT